MCSGAELFTTGSLRLMEGGNGNMEATPIFRTGSGRSVEAKKSSISRALAILGDEGDQIIQTGATYLQCRHFIFKLLRYTKYCEL